MLLAVRGKALQSMSGDACSLLWEMWEVNNIFA